MANVKIRLKKGDQVVVRSGKYKGKTGKILATFPRDNTATVEGINTVKKHLKPNREHPQGGIIDLLKPINVSKLGIYDPTTKKASRISFKVSADGKKERTYAKGGKVIKEVK
jgi:large subunit ribosomal protein L24